MSVDTAAVLAAIREHGAGLKALSSTTGEPSLPMAQALVRFMYVLEDPLAYIDGLRPDQLRSAAERLACAAVDTLLDELWQAEGHDHGWGDERCGVPHMRRWRIVVQLPGRTDLARIAVVVPLWRTLNATFVLHEGQVYTVSDSSILVRTYLDDQGGAPPCWVWWPGCGAPVARLEERLVPLVPELGAVVAKALLDCARQQVQGPQGPQGGPSGPGRAA